MTTTSIPAERPPRSCPALLISAPASGQGKTTVTAALVRHWRQRGLRVRVFKTGPDFIDPMVHVQASGQPCYQLDLWMGGEAQCRELLWQAAGESDLILVEGVMGLHDGATSSAELAVRFSLPVLAVIDAGAMAQTFGAIALGLKLYRPEMPFAGVLANRVGSAGHAQMVAESLPDGIVSYGALPRDEALAWPSRHLGLVQAAELPDLERRLDAAATVLAQISLPLPPPVCFAAPPEPEDLPRALQGVCIAVARDAAFSFLYPANLDVLRQLGAELLFFSPLADEPVPESAHALYLPGGYPELHLATLARNERVRASVRAHHAAGRPIVAECGGLLALSDRLTDTAGDSAPMWGLVPGEGVMQQRLVNLGMHSATRPDGTVRGHTFHHGAFDSPLVPAGQTQAQRHHGRAESLWRIGRLHASFLHLYFPSNPLAVAALFNPEP
jgi:cobyrinic acid a,c-diamide synthase